MIFSHNYHLIYKHDASLVNDLYRRIALVNGLYRGVALVNDLYRGVALVNDLYRRGIYIYKHLCLLSNPYHALYCVIMLFNEINKL